MADVRTLLKAKRQEARIVHPLASYTSAGQLRCSACGTTIKHAAAWEGHVGSKAHRVAVARLKEEEARREEEERHARKRKATPEVSLADAGMDEDVVDDGPDPPDGAPKKRRLESEERGAAGFPGDFFSDPSRAIPSSTSDSEDEGESNTVNSATSGSINLPSTVDVEWEAFQKFINAPGEQDNNARETFERATVFAEPELVPDGAGLPIGVGVDAAVQPEELTEEEKRQRKEQEERELIMDRLMDEERAQEEADAKVSVLKARLDALRQRREIAKQRRTVN
jgi:zinc finger protein 830